MVRRIQSRATIETMLRYEFPFFYCETDQFYECCFPLILTLFFLEFSHLLTPYVLTYNQCSLVVNPLLGMLGMRVISTCRLIFKWWVMVGLVDRIYRYFCTLCFYYLHKVVVVISGKRFVDSIAVQAMKILTSLNC